MEDTGLFVIDLSGCSNTGEIINNVSLALEIPNASSKGISLKLKDNVLNQSQILSIKSLIESYNSRLINVETTSLITQNACKAMGIDVVAGKVLHKEPQIIKEETETIEEEAPKPVQQKSVKPEKAVEMPKEAYTGPVSSVQAEALNKFKELKEELSQEAAAKPDKTEQTQNEEEIDGFERQTISVYKKASEENLQSEEELEEINFYLPPTDEPVVVDSKQTIYVNQTLRSGQTLEFDGNIVIIGDCHPGSEIKATGDITVWGVLGSIAHAGSKGNRDAKIRALKMNAVQLRIANCYSRRPDSGNIPYIVKSAIFTPEEARIVDNNIVLFKMANQ